MKKRLALHGVDLSVGLPIANRLTEVIDRLRPDFVRGWQDGANTNIATAVQSTANDAATAVGRLLDLAHGANVPTPLVPTLPELNHLRGLLNVFAALLNEHDRPWLDTYTASLALGQRRLVNSMIFKGNARLASG